MNEIKFSKKSIGGSRPIANGHNWLLRQSGFNIDVKYLPNDGYIPAGTALVCDETTMTAKPVKIAKVTAVSSTEVSIALQTPYITAPFIVGESVMKLGTDLTTAGTSATISKIENDTDVTKITLSAELSGLAANDYIILAESDKPVGTPNAIAPYDIVKESTDAIYKFTPAAIGFAGEIFLRRIPAMPELIKVALANSGCNFHWSESL